VEKVEHKIVERVEIQTVKKVEGKVLQPVRHKAEKPVIGKAVTQLKEVQQEEAHVFEQSPTSSHFHKGSSLKLKRR